MNGGLSQFARVLDSIQPRSPWPSWVPRHFDSKLIGIGTDHTGAQWAFIEGTYETSSRKIVPFHTAYSDHGHEEVINFWSSEKPTLEHFRKLMEMGFPPAGYGIPFFGNWTCDRLDAVFDAYENGDTNAQDA
jgi:hypothetical protein